MVSLTGSGCQELEVLSLRSDYSKYYCIPPQVLGYLITWNYLTLGLSLKDPFPRQPISPALVHSKVILDRLDSSQYLAYH